MEEIERIDMVSSRNSILASVFLLASSVEYILISGGPTRVPYVVIASLAIQFFCTFLMGTDRNIQPLLFHLFLILNISVLFVIPQTGLYGWDSPQTYYLVGEIIQGADPLQVIGTPLLHILSILTGEIISKDMVFVLKYLPLGLSVGIYLGFFLILKKLYNHQMAIIGVLSIGSIWFFVSFHTWAIKEALGFPLLLMSIYILEYSGFQKKIKQVVIIPLVSALSMAHHLSTFILILFIFASIFVQFIYKAEAISKLYEYLSVIVTIGFIWVYLVITPLLSGVYLVSTTRETILSLFFGVPSGGSTVSSTQSPGINPIQTIFQFQNDITMLQVLWRGGLMHAPWFSGIKLSVLFIGLCLILHFVRAGMSNKKLSVQQSVLFICLLSLVILFAISIFADGIGGRRIIEISWIFSISLLYSLSKMLNTKKHLRSALCIFIIINIVTLPVYSFSTVHTPDYYAGEQDFGYKHSDYTARSWSSSYMTASITSDIKYMRFWRADRDLESYSGGMYMNLNFSTTRSAYLFVSPSSRSMLLTSQGYTRTPPQYSLERDIHNIYTSGTSNSKNIDIYFYDSD